MGRVVALVNQKGGVGKTTTAVSLASALAIAERPTLLVDVDPQANSTRALGIEHDPERPCVYDALVDEDTFDEIMIVVDQLPCLALVPSERNLVGAEVELVDADQREFRLKRHVDAVREGFDFVIIDCPPSLGMLTINALAAADSVMIPVQCEYLALEGITQLMDTIQRIRSALNPDLEIEGILMTMFDERTNLARQVVDEVRNVFGKQVYKTVIPRNVRLGEAPSHGTPIFLYDIKSKGSEAYFSLAEEFLTHEAKSTGQRVAKSDSRSTAEKAGGGRSGTRPPQPGHRQDSPQSRPAARGIRSPEP